MLKQDITFTNFHDEVVTESHYFNLSKGELIELEMVTPGGFAAKLMRIAESEDSAKIFQEFKEIIGMTYGRRSEDGSRFIKSDEIRDDFFASEAFSELIYSFFTDATKAADFANGLLPKALVEEARVAAAEQQKAGGGPALTAVADEKSEDLTFEDYTKAQLLEMPQEQFIKLVGTSKPLEMSKEQLLIAMERQNKK